MNFQAAVTAIASVYMARGRPLLWLDKLADDTPIAIDAETSGAGDDLRLLLADTRTVEVQVKKGLKSGPTLWKALLKLATAVTADEADFGVLAVSPSSSNTIAHDLAEDIVRIGDGRRDGLSDIATRFLDQLTAAGIDPRAACARIRITTVSALATDQAAVLAAQAEVAHLCADAAQVGAAWHALYADAAALIEQRGRRDASSVVRLLAAVGIALVPSTDAAPAQLLAKLVCWTLETHQTFAIFGAATPLKIDEAWIPLTAIVRDESAAEAASLEEALRRYQAWETRAASRDARSVDPETLGRFVTKAVVVAGPGMGKTTLLKRVARRYSEDAIPVLRVRLAAVAARMQAGASFEEAVFHLGLDGSGIPAADALRARLPNWTLLCDGLDECGALQEEVAAGVARFASGHPHSRILVTTRPIGYRAVHFSDWRHYDLSALDASATHAHAARLIKSIAPPGSELHRNAGDISGRELRDTPAANTVGRTPLLLGLAVAILVRGRNLGATRERLFEQIFELIDEAPNARIPERPAPAVVLRRFLDLLGWHITSRPLAAIDDTLDRCAANLAGETGTKRLAALADADRYLRYWQDAGMIERVGHGGQQTLAFIHKSFGEFAAARYVQALPQADQAAAVADMIDAPAFAEVVRFAGMMGLADVIATELLVAPGDQAVAKPVALAAAVMAEADPPPNRELRGRIIERSFEIAAANRRPQAFEVGGPLVAAARRFPDEVGPTAGTHLDAGAPWTRLIAWACAVAAGPDHYVLDELVATLLQSVDAAGPGMQQSLGGGLNLARGNGHDLAEALVLEACDVIIDRASAEVADALIPELLNHGNLGSMRFVRRAHELMRAKGRNYHRRIPDWSGRSLFDLPEGYLEAQQTMYDAIFDALDVPEAGSADEGPAPRPLLHLSALIEASQMNEVAAGDIWAWSRSFDRDAIREALRGLIAISGLDREKLRDDALQARRHLRTAAKGTFLFGVTTSVDPPPVDWARAKSLDLDVQRIEAAVAHPSLWIKWVAANLLGAILDPDGLERAVRRLFDAGRQRTLWAACGLAAKLDRDRALALVLDRLAKVLVPGCAHLFDWLRHPPPPYSPALETAVRAGLFADVDTAAAAAALAAEMVGPQRAALAPILEQAYAHWLVHEEPYPSEGGVVPTSPRAKLVEALNRIRPPAYERIKAWLRDARYDVREIGEQALVERLRSPAGERLQFFKGVEAGDLPGHVLGNVLKGGLSLEPGELAAAEALLTSPRDTVRYGAMALLTEDYLPSDRIRALAQAMTRDSAQQIKDRAFAILDRG